MGHDTHFLTRLERVTSSHAELALSLYRDPQLVRFVLDNLELPEGAERVALALDQEPGTPYLLVDREGHFVTCLGYGMRPDPTVPVVRRERLASLSARISQLRERIAQAEALVGEGRETSRVLSRLHEAGSRLTREEFVAISSFQPLLAGRFLLELFATSRLLRRARNLLHHVRKVRPRDEPALYEYWKLLYRLGHLALLSTMGELEALEHLDEDGARLLAWPMVREGAAPIALRGFWAAGRAGRRCLGPVKRALGGPLSHHLTMQYVLSLLAIGLRQARLRAEVRKALIRSAPPEEDQSFEACAARYARSLGNAAAKLLDCPDEVRARAVSFARDQLSQDGLRPPSPFPRAEEVPEDLAVAYWANLALDYLNDVKQLLLFCEAMSVAVRAPPEHLYYPRDALHSFFPREEFNPLWAVDVLEGQRLAAGRRHPARTPARPERNDPCPCGSGRKYKRCCAE